ncbi:MAG: hypothetical protein Kow0042_08280 [Calditrichia bacterium]
MKNSKIAGFILIIAGLLILLHNADIEVLNWDLLKGLLPLIFGVYLFSKGISHPQKKGIFGGSWFVLLGIYLLLDGFHIIEISRGLTISVLTMVTGISFLVAFIFRRNSWAYLLTGTLVLFIGLFFLLVHLYILPGYLLIEVVDRYWPILLILLGLFIIIDGLKKIKPPPYAEAEKS